MEVTTEVLTVPSDRDAAAVARLVGQMSSRGEPDPKQGRTRDRRGDITDRGSPLRIGHCRDSHPPVVETIVGRFGYVEEVAVEETLRGQGLGRRVMRRLVEVALEHNLDFVELTSRPTRVAANGLYRSLGFDQRETNVFRMRLKPVNR